MQRRTTVTVMIPMHLFLQQACGTLMVTTMDSVVRLLYCPVFNPLDTLLKVTTVMMPMKTFTQTPNGTLMVTTMDMVLVLLSSNVTNQTIMY